MPCHRRCQGASRRNHCRWPVIILVLACSVVLGEDTPPFDAGKISLLPNRFGLLLLTSGRIISGRLNQTSGGYDVAQEHGRIFVPYEMVRFEASDLQEAHQRIRASMPADSAANHIDVARWCVSHGLYAEARKELADALKLDATREDARRMLRRIEELINPDLQENIASPPAPPAASDGFEPAEASSLAGLSRDSAREFTTKIQPILMNKCGNARCHGESAENQFRLTRVHIGQGVNRVQTEKNLAATLKFINGRDVHESRLMASIEENHGNAGRAIFYGPAGASQRRLLREWILTVSRRLQPADEAEPEQPSLAESEEEAFVTGVLRDDRSDEFDPAIFNDARGVSDSGNPLPQ